jgi:hypothetical protein
MGNALKEIREVRINDFPVGAKQQSSTSIFACWAFRPGR